MFPGKGVRFLGESHFTKKNRPPKLSTQLPNKNLQTSLSAYSETVIVAEVGSVITSCHVR